MKSKVHIALVDDRREFADERRQKIEEQKGWPFHVGTKVFTSADDLIDAIEKEGEYFEVIITDVFMPKRGCQYGSQGSPEEGAIRIKKWLEKKQLQNPQFKQVQLRWISRLSDVSSFIHKHIGTHNQSWLRWLAQHEKSSFYKADFLPCVKTAVEMAITNVFQRQGQGWKVRFEGQETILQESFGAEYIHTLLSKPHTKVDVLDLLKLSPEEKISLKQQQGSSPERITEETGIKYREQCNELKDKMKAAEDVHDYKRAAEYDEELTKLRKELEASVNRHGRLRKSIAPLDTKRKAVWKNIMTVRQELKTSLPSLAQHLKSCLKTGMKCCYRLDKEMIWQL